MPGPENLFSKCGTEKYKSSHRRFTSHPGQLTICVGRHSYLMSFWPLPHQVMKFSCSHSVPSFCLLSSLTGNVRVSPPAPPFFIPPNSLKSRALSASVNGTKTANPYNHRAQLSEARACFCYLLFPR